MKKHVFILSFICLTLLACQPKNEEQNANNQPTNEKTTVSNQIQIAQPIQLNNKKCQTIDKEQYCDEIIIETDTFKNPTLNNYIYQTITGSENKLDKDLKTALTDYSQQQLEKLSLRYKDEDSKIYPYAYESNDNLQLINNNANFTFFKHQYTEYTGGAHPNTFVYNLVIDPNTYNDILLDNMFLPNGQDELFKLQQEATFQTLLKKDLSEEEVKELMSSWDIQLNKNWGFDENNLLFTYSPYEAAPYAYGVIDIAIPKDKLQDIIQPEYLNLIFPDSNDKKEQIK
ncbi:MAG: DUF3298 and DUF4163 domain-containing protein [Neisseriaceae bacterium]|nr:DUF3298 and DUF4163 domain-containing protein [Neisseriaceae bacterium]